MISNEEFAKLALSLPDITEEPHFEKPSYRIKKKIVATLDTKNNRACLKLSAIDQSVFSAYDSSIIYPVPNSWGKQGWTFVELKKVRKTVLRDALKKAYEEVNTPKAKKK